MFSDVAHQMYIVEIIEESLYVPLNKNILYCTLGWEHLSLVYWHYTLHLTRAGGIWRLIKKEKEKGRFVFCDLKRGGWNVRPLLSRSCPWCWNMQPASSQHLSHAGKYVTAWSQEYTWRHREDERFKNVASFFVFVWQVRLKCYLKQGT